MNILYRGSNSTTLVPIESLLFAERKIFIEGEINSQSANDFTKSILLLSKEKDPIDVYINSSGGDVTAGLAIRDIINAISSSVDVKLHCIGIAASMAAVILSGGKEGNRFITPNSKVFIHEVISAGGCDGSASAVRRKAEEVLQTQRLFVELLSKDTGKTEDEIAAAMAEERYFTADQALDFGLADHIEYSFT